MKKKISKVSGKKKSFTIRLNDEKTKEKLQKIADENDTFLNEVANEALEMYCKKNCKETKEK
jgi:predicted transcriptional regulator